MKKQLFTAIALSGLVLTLAGTVMAKPSNRELINKRQLNQQHRIQQGIQSGELTRPEVINLEQQQVRIQKVKRHALLDGGITLRELRHITAMQDRASKNIFAKKHNNRKRRY